MDPRLDTKEVQPSENKPTEAKSSTENTPPTTAPKKINVEQKRKLPKWYAQLLERKTAEVKSSEKKSDEVKSGEVKSEAKKLEDEYMIRPRKKQQIRSVRQRIKENEQKAAAKPQNLLPLGLEPRWLQQLKQQLQGPVTAVQQDRERLVARHGSSGGKIIDKLERLFSDPEMIAGTVWGGDVNFDLLLQENRTWFHIFLARKGLKISEEGLDYLIQHLLRAVFKMRIDAIVNPQSEKINKPVFKLVDLLVYLEKMVLEQAPVGKIRFDKNPVDMSIKERLELTRNQPVYIAYKNKNGKEFFYFATTNGELSEVTANSPDNAVKMATLFPEKAKILVQSTEEKDSLEIQQYTDHRPHQSCINPRLTKSLEAGEALVERFTARVNDLPKKDVESINKLIREEFPEVMNFYDIENSNGQDHLPQFHNAGCNIFRMSNDEKPVNSDLSNLYLYKDKKTQDIFYYVNDQKILLEDEDHTLTEAIKTDPALGLQSFIEHFENPKKCRDEEIYKAILPITSARGHTFSKSKEIDGSINSMAHSDINPNHFKVPLTATTWNDYHMMFNAFNALNVREGMKLMILRNYKRLFPEYKEDEGDTYTQSFEKLTGKNVSPENKEKLVKAFEALLRNDKKFPGLTDQAIDNLLKNYADMLEPNSHLFNDTEEYNPEVLTVGPFKYLSKYYEVLDVYQKIMDDDPKIVANENDLPRREDILEFYELAKTEEYTRIYSLLTNPPYADPHKQLCSLADPSNTDYGKNMKDELSRLHKLSNIMLGKLNLTPPNKPGITVCPSTDGSAPPRDRNNKVLTPKELTELQIDDILARIYQQHLLNPQEDIKLALIEIDGQPEKQKIVTDCVNIINDFVNDDPNTFERMAYHQMMEQWAEKYSKRTLALCDGNRDEVAIITATREDIVEDRKRMEFTFEATQKSSLEDLQGLLYYYHLLNPSITFSPVIVSADENRQKEFDKCVNTINRFIETPTVSEKIAYYRMMSDFQRKYSSNLNELAHKGSEMRYDEREIIQKSQGDIRRGAMKYGVTEMADGARYNAGLFGNSKDRAAAAVADRAEMAARSDFQPTPVLVR